ncbi:MAG: Flp pilus assembly complex ATPase component TadA [Magnetococcales bacterium]|nr:Flp pilus assembly complex ATPase component TadA [Magnetococcales bacterium]NGZ26599.1 Flp pilus assembly complex ATPase component TadA [Magnetococcales bacterium]
MSEPVRRKPIGELLQEKGLITPGHIQLALQDQKITQERLGEVLERLGFVSQFDVATTISLQDGRPYLDVDHVLPDAKSMRLFNMNFCLSNRFLPIKHDANAIEVVTASDDVDALERLITRNTSLRPIFFQGEKSKVQNAIQYYFYFLDNPVEKLLDREMQLLASDVDNVRSLDIFLGYLLQLAVKNRASDIHIRPMDRTISIAFRVDGVLRAMFAMPLSFKRLTTAIKMKAEMDIAEQRLPQDGSFSETILNNRYDFRVSSTVCPFGENLVLRLLPAKGDFMSLQQLGFFDEDIQTLREIFNEPFGIALLTGPTGSGKTTTLYAAVRALNLTEKNVLTVENPIEYRIPLVRQTQINVKAGYTFANAIRFFLRHDPDVILVGEIRDKETAETAISASETGHMVLSTLHTNTALGAIPRLRSLGIPPFMLADAMVGLVSQRLVRRICHACKEEYTPSQAELDYLKTPELTTLYRGKGCDLCTGTGYLGRTLVYEVVRNDQTLSKMIYSDASVDMLEEHARSRGFRNIFQNGVRKVHMGITTVDELVRVLGH